MRTVHSMFAPSLALTMWLGSVGCTAAMPGAPPQHVPATATALSAGLPWAQTLDASPTFTPDGNTAVFSRGTGLARRLCITHRRDGRWSTPKRAPFSGPWMDLEPAMAPDGSYLVFVSNRPATAGGKALDGYFGGKPRPGRGGNLWRVERLADGWGTPVRLPELVNASSATYAPAVAADGSLYFMRPDPHTGHFRLYRSTLIHGRFAPPQPLPFSDGLASDVDPAVAPDQSFLVFSSNRAPTPAGEGDLFVAFATAKGWGPAIHLGLSGDEARLDPRLAWLYFTAADNRMHRLPIARWLAQHAPRQCAGPRSSRAAPNGLPERDGKAVIAHLPALSPISTTPAHCVDERSAPDAARQRG